MRLNTRFSDAIHVLAFIHVRAECELSSSYIAKSVMTNPFLIRNIVSDLKQSGLVVSKQGRAGTKLTRDPNEISLLEIFEAVDNNELLHVDNNTNQGCVVGGNIQNVLTNYFRELDIEVKKNCQVNHYKIS